MPCYCPTRTPKLGDPSVTGYYRTLTTLGGICGDVASVGVILRAHPEGWCIIEVGGGHTPNLVPSFPNNGY